MPAPAIDKSARPRRSDAAAVGARARRGGRRSCAGEGGFTLIEVLVAAVVMALGVTALFGLLDTSAKTIESTRAREGATNLARGILENATTIPYAQVSPTSIASDLQATAGLADASPAPGWQVIHNGITYTVTVSECAIDDPKDGYGIHDGTFCPESSIQSPVTDSQPADLKRITVDVTWVAHGRSPDVHEVAMLTAAGESVGLSASSLRLTSPFESTAPLITSEPLLKELRFAVTAPGGTTSVVWSLEGVRQSPAPVHESEASTTWRFSWPIAGLSDGTYQVAAQAVNGAGVIGPPVSIQVTLIRGEPAAPSSIVGGFNTVYVSSAPAKVVELQWHADPERNVIGYRVYRPGTREPSQLACPASLSTLSLSTSCIDFSPPSPTAANLKYEVVALYRKAEGETLSKTLSEGPPGSVTVLGGEPLPSGPNVPNGSLNLTHNVDGSVTLNWSASKGIVPVAFYRIYRGSTNYTGRYDTSSSTSYTDTDATTAHSYWVTAVSSSLVESEFLGPVTG